MAFAAASTVLHDLLRAPERPLQVLAALPSAVYLRVVAAASGPAGAGAEGGAGGGVGGGHGEPRIVALLARDAVRVPIGMLLALPRQAAPFAAVSAGQPGTIGDGALRLGGEAYRPVRYWDPRVPQLRAGLATPAAMHRCDALAALTDQLPEQLRVSLTGDLLDSLAAAPARPQPKRPQPSRLLAAVGALVGLGPGLTPAGDDVLAGALLALAAAGDLSRRQALACAVEGLLDRTAPLSAALLEQACRSRAVPEVGALLRALAGGGDLDAALVALSLVGHTSGPALALGIRLALQAGAGRTLGRAA